MRQWSCEDMLKLQRRLVGDGAVLIYFKDAKPGDANYEALQFFALRGFLGSNRWEAKLDEAVSKKDATDWIGWAGVSAVKYRAGETLRGELLGDIYDKVLQKDSASIASIYAND